MSENVRFIKAENIAEKLSVINDRTYAYCETEEEQFQEAIQLFMEEEPMLWMENDWNRQQCYSNMYSKLFLAYLCSEIKNGNILDASVLEKYGDNMIDTWEMFRFLDIGGKTATVLEQLVREVIKKEGLFQSECLYFDLSDYRGIEDWDDYTEDFVYKMLIDEIPELKRVMDPKKSSYSFSNLAWEIVRHEEFELEMEVVKSKILYQIYQKERNHKTALGNDILNLCDKIFRGLVHQDYLTYGLSWEVIDHERKVISYYMITSSEVLGDDGAFSEECTERIHRFNYESIFKILGLQEKIKKYKL